MDPGINRDAPDIVVPAQAESRRLVSSKGVVVPAQAGTERLSAVQTTLGSRLRGSDGKGVVRAMIAVSVVLFASAPLLATAADLPKRKSGLWEVKTAAAPGGPAGALAQMCIDQSTDDLTRQLAGVGIPCSKNAIRREAGDRYVIDSVCQIGESTATSRAVLTGNFDSGYQVDIQANYSPPLMNMSEGRSTISSKWLGPCKAGQRPGDLVMPNGMTINVFDASKIAPMITPKK